MAGSVRVLWVSWSVTGSLRWRWATRRISGGMVAEKSAVCRPAVDGGAWARIHSTSSMKPMRSISSASSSTTMRKRSRRSVPPTTWTPRCSRRVWSSSEWPP